MFEPGWLKKQFEMAEEDIKNWPEWMRREANKLNHQEIKTKNNKDNQKSRAQEKKR